MLREYDCAKGEDNYLEDRKRWTLVIRPELRVNAFVPLIEDEVPTCIEHVAVGNLDWKSPVLVLHRLTKENISQVHEILRVKSGYSAQNCIDVTHDAVVAVLGNA